MNKLSLRENCQWFNLEKFDILTLRGVFEEIEKDKEYIFRFEEEYIVYHICNGDFIKYRDKIYKVRRIERNSNVFHHIVKVELEALNNEV